MSFQTKLYYLREYLFPYGCGGCEQALLTPQEAYYGLCEACRAFLNSALLDNKKRCKFCGKPLISERETCLKCRENRIAGNENYSEHLVKLKALFPYSGRFKSILSAYKFKKSIGLGNYLAHCLSNSVDCISRQEPQCAWVPVPPRPGKLKQHGWDQVEFLARLLEKEKRLLKPQWPLHRCLKRLPSKSQKELNREEREINLKGRIQCVKRPAKTVILFDDVITTGATIDACAAALLEGGADKVYGICLFYD